MKETLCESLGPQNDTGKEGGIRIDEESYTTYYSTLLGTGRDSIQINNKTVLTR